MYTSTSKVLFKSMGELVSGLGTSVGNWMFIGIYLLKDTQI